jgi:hypothetical protein
MYGQDLEFVFVGLSLVFFGLVIVAVIESVRHGDDDDRG